MITESERRATAWADAKAADCDRSHYAQALTATVACTRRFPDFRLWFKQHDQPGEVPFQRAAVLGWLNQIEGYLRRGSYRRRRERTEHLLDTAEDFLRFDQPELLAQTWYAAVATDTWRQLPPAAKWLYRAVMALARSHASFGGQRVLLSDRAAMEVIVALGGPRYGSLATIFRARACLAQTELVEITRGQQWEKGKIARPARYELPLPTTTPLSPDNSPSDSGSVDPLSRREQPQAAPKGDCFLEPVPQLSEDQEQAVHQLFVDLRANRERTEGQQDTEAAVLVADESSSSWDPEPWECLPSGLMEVLGLVEAPGEAASAAGLTDWWSDPTVPAVGS
jgi:hypothetical protein